MNTKNTFFRQGCSLPVFVLLEVVEAEGEDLEDDLKEDLHPVVFLVFSLLFHCGKN